MSERPAKRRRFRFGLLTMFVVVTIFAVSAALAAGLIHLSIQATEREYLLAGQVHVYMAVPFDRPRPETGEFKRLGVTFGGPLEGDLTFEQAEIVRRIRLAFPEAEVRVMHDLRGPWLE